MTWIDVVWMVGRRLPKRAADAIARLAAPLVELASPRGVAEWSRTTTIATGQVPDRAMRRQVVGNWLRNYLWSLSLGGWGASLVEETVQITDDDWSKTTSSLAGPGLVLALPHMGSWDCAGMLCGARGVHVVSVAERMPAGLYEKYKAARAQMGMTIYPVGEPQIMAKLSRHVRDGDLVCLLADRDMSKRAVVTHWPGDDATLSVPGGPAALALATGADLRVAVPSFHGSRMRLEVTDVIGGDDVEQLMQGVVDEFAAAVRRYPTSWLMMRRLFT